MHPAPTSAFALPDHLAAKADAALIASDDQQLAAVAATLAASIAELETRVADTRAAPGGDGEAALVRDQEIHRLTGRLRTLQRNGTELCLGRTVDTDGAAMYIGRLGLTDPAGTQLLVDWRSPAAAPFFAATLATPLGLVSRRRYRWVRGRIVDYWDEVFATGPQSGRAALDDQSAFIASLGSARTSRMRDVLGTIQADQDAIIRAGSAGTLVVDGGPGTGKTVVALHRAAYLLYADPRLRQRDGRHRGGVLFVGPHQPYLDYVADVLPGLGEDSVQTCTLRDLVPGGVTAPDEPDAEVARLKSSLELVRAIEPAVALYEEPPTAPLTLETYWGDVRLAPAEWAEAFAVPDPGTPHNEARDQVWDEVLAILVDKVADLGDVDETPEQLRAALVQHRVLVGAFGRAWPLLDPADVVGDLWTVPAYLRRCAPGLRADEVRALQRSDPASWTTADLPLLDAARARVGDPEAARRKRRYEAGVAAERERMSTVIDDLIAADDSELLLMTSLRHDDLRDALVDDSGLPTADPGRFAGPFAHVVVDEAQELTDAQWQMVLRRCPSRSFTVVGDRAQARHGFAETWQQRLTRIGLDRIDVTTLSINYRTPEEVMAYAEPVIRAVLPDANVPSSVRASGIPVAFGTTSELDEVVTAWLAEQADGTACVISRGEIEAPWPASRVRVLRPELSKGLEFDLVVLVDPQTFGEPGDEIGAAVDRYVAMTRATRRLVVLTHGYSPDSA